VLGGAVGKVGSKVGVRKNAVDDFTQLFSNGTPKASDIIKYAESKEWKPTKSGNGPVKYVDENGISRLTIKKGSSRAPGSNNPHIEIKDAGGQRVDIKGNPVSRKSQDNHTPIEWDIK
jgi:hypothetical protein